MFSVDIYSILDVAGKYLLLILKPSSYLKLNIFMLLKEKTAPVSVANQFEKFSARSEIIQKSCPS
jgi:hypothetical protein